MTVTFSLASRAIKLFDSLKIVDGEVVGRKSM